MGRTYDAFDAIEEENEDEVRRQSRTERANGDGIYRRTLGRNGKPALIFAGRVEDVENAVGRVDRVRTLRS